MKNKTASELTVEFLRAIAQRLSGRSSCKQIEYVVCIGMDDDTVSRQMSLADVESTHNKVFFYPERLVFPDTHHRQKSDLTDVVKHVMKEQFADTVFDHEDQFGKVCFRDGSLVPGIYQYVLSFDKKRRTWIRIK